jgi:parvulin-like peptidyl-prolyl isomerase
MNGLPVACFLSQPSTLNPQPCRLLSLFFVPCSLFLLSAGAREPAPDDVANTVAVRVNGQAVALSQVEALFADSLRLIGEKLKRGELRPADRAAAVREAWGKALQTAIQDALLDQLGASRRDQIIRGYVMRADPTTQPGRVMESFRRLEADGVRRLRDEVVAAAGGEAEMRAALQKRGQTLRDWEADLRRELFRREALYTSLGYINASPAAAKAYYDAHPEEFGQPDAWALRRIHIPKAKFTSPEAAAQAAALIRAKLAQGADFALLAAELRYDPPYDEQGGLLSVNGQTGLPSGNFPAEERIAAGLTDGQVSDPVDTGAAFLIVKREAYRPAKVLAFEEAVEQAAARAFTEKVKEKKEEFFARQKKEALIEILVPQPPRRHMDRSIGDF